MSLCPECGHNSVFHGSPGGHGTCAVQSVHPTLGGVVWCGCRIDRFSPEWRNHTDERGNPLPGHAAYRGER